MDLNFDYVCVCVCDGVVSGEEDAIGGGHHFLRGIVIHFKPIFTNSLVSVVLISFDRITTIFFSQKYLKRLRDAKLCSHLQKNSLLGRRRIRENAFLLPFRWYT